MLAIVKSMALHGLDGYLVDVQVDVSQGLPAWEIVGLPDASIKEAKERVKTAIKNSGIDFQSKKIVVNLAPADTKKEGSSFDLPMAVGILYALEDISEIDEQTVFIGELSLDGRINRVNGILPMCIEATNLGIKRIILPKENAQEAGVVNNIDVIPVSNLKELVEYLNKIKDIKPVKINCEEIFNVSSQYEADFSEVKGQENIKRALEVAAAGNHNCLLIGSPRLRKNNACKKITINFTRFDF